MSAMHSVPGPPGTRLVAVGAARPAAAHTAAGLGAPFGKDGDWVTARTGITTLRRLAENESIEDLAVAAGRRALDRAALPRPVDLVITASCSSPPGSGHAVARRLAPRAAWLEINSACSGFCYSLATADSLIRGGAAQSVLVVAAEQMSRLLDPDDLGTSIIFGDGAGAAVITAADEPGVGPLVCGSDGAHADLIANDSRGRLTMQGRSVFRWAVETVPGVVTTACERAGVTPADLDAFVPHQANLRIIEAVTRKLDLDHAVVSTDVTSTGNTSAASIPLAIDSMLRRHPLLGGKLAVLAGFGAGLSYAAQVIRMPETA